jgi:hypothetical protein
MYVSLSTVLLKLFPCGSCNFAINYHGTRNGTALKLLKHRKEKQNNKEHATPITL